MHQYRTLHTYNKCTVPVLTICIFPVCTWECQPIYTVTCMWSHMWTGGMSDSYTTLLSCSVCFTVRLKGPHSPHTGNTSKLHGLSSKVCLPCCIVNEPAVCNKCEIKPSRLNLTSVPPSHVTVKVLLFLERPPDPRPVFICPSHCWFNPFSSATRPDHSQVGITERITLWTALGWLNRRVRRTTVVSNPELLFLIS